MNLYNQRLEQIKYVVDNSKYVHINKEKLKKFVDTNDFIIMKKKHWLSDYINKFTEKEIILFLFLIQSINYCFWKEPIFIYEHDQRSSAMFKIFLDKVLINKKLLNVNYLNSLSYDDFVNIFEIEEGNIKNRYLTFMETVRFIYNNNNFYSDIFNLQSVDELYNYIVSNFKSFNDIALYNDKEIFFYKRSTLLIQELFKFSSTIKSNIKTIDSCLGCADYVIPKGLRSLSILTYDSVLDDIINQEKLIEAGSIYEIEIRANMLYVLELMKKRLKENGIIINSIELDNIMWKYSRKLLGKHHKTDTIFY